MMETDSHCIVTAFECEHMSVEMAEVVEHEGTLHPTPDILERRIAVA